MRTVIDVMDEERERQAEIEEEKKRKFMIFNGEQVSIRRIIRDMKERKRELSEG